MCIRDRSYFGAKYRLFSCFSRKAIRQACFNFVTFITSAEFPATTSLSSGLTLSDQTHLVGNQLYYVSL